jgi:hypothetical protein
VGRRCRGRRAGRAPSGPRAGGGVQTEIPAGDQVLQRRERRDHLTRRLIRVEQPAHGVDLIPGLGQWALWEHEPGRVQTQHALAARPPGSVPLLFCGVILRSAGLLGCRRWLSCEVQIRALVQVSLVMGKRLLSVVFGSWAGGIGKIV